MAENHLLAKSEQNLKAAALLLSEEYYAPAVHTGYYSCLQKVKYILMEYYPEDFEKLGTLKSDGTGNSHMDYIRTLAKWLRRSDEDDAFEFDRKMKQLKNYRITSDYSQNAVVESDAVKTLGIAEKVHTIIKTHMHF
jgi:uncharacterized protein (UPF0332 family)